MDYRNPDLPLLLILDNIGRIYEKSRRRSTTKRRPTAKKEIRDGSPLSTRDRNNHNQQGGSSSSVKEDQQQTTSVRIITTSARDGGVGGLTPSTSTRSGNQACNLGGALQQLPTQLKNTLLFLYKDNLIIFLCLKKTLIHVSFIKSITCLNLDYT